MTGPAFELGIVARLGAFLPAVAAGLIGFTAGIALGAAMDNDYYYGPYGWGGGFRFYDDAWDDWYDHREDAREDWMDHREDIMEDRGDVVVEKVSGVVDPFASNWRPYRGGDIEASTDTRYEREALGREDDVRELGRRFCPREGLRRVRERGQRPLPESSLDRLEAEALDFHDRVRKGYLHLAQEEPQRFQIIDATQPEGVIAAEIWARVERLIGNRAIQQERR